MFYRFICGCILGATGLSQGAVCAIQSAKQIQQEVEKISSDLSEFLLEQEACSKESIGKTVSDSLRKWVPLKRCCENVGTWFHSSNSPHTESINKVVRNIKINSKRLELCLKAHHGSREVIAGLEEIFYKYLVKMEEDLRSLALQLKTATEENNNQ